MKNKILLIITILSISIISLYTLDIYAETDEVITKTESITKNENIVFLGDSIFDWFPTHKIFSDLPIVNSGKSGNTTKDILDNMENRVYKYNPTKVFINIGTNDIQYDDSEEVNIETYENITKIVENIKNNRKKSKIYVISIYPVNNNLSGAGGRHNDEIIEINSRLKTYCSEVDGVEYIDAYSQLVGDDGMFDSEYTNDGLHPNGLGYAKLTEILMKYIYK